jgi:hypothetical protein
VLLKKFYICYSLYFKRLHRKEKFIFSHGTELAVRNGGNRSLDLTDSDFKETKKWQKSQNQSLKASK